MLISKPLSIGDVACVRLITGEEMIARVSDIAAGSTEFTVTKPILLQIHVDPQTNQPVGIGFGAFMVGVEEDSKFVIARSHMLVAPMRARDDLQAKYQEMTGSVIMPKKSGLII